MYYKSNALYEYLLSNNIPNFSFAYGNIWQLVYGNSRCEPKLLVLASGVKTEQLNSELSSKEIESLQIFKQIRVKTGINIRMVRFPIDTNEVEKVLTFRNEEKPEIVTMSDLTELFYQDDLPVSNTKTAKYLNDKTSSAYHNWQRSSLGRDLKVSDFDLWTINDKGEVLRVYELKRSYYSLEKWQPFTDDYNNFRLISNALIGTNIDFKIAYNVRTKTPWCDDISKFKVFNVNRGSQLIQFDRIYNLEELLEDL